MNRLAAIVLLKSLLERLESDAAGETPHITGLVSASERAALRYLIEGVFSEDSADNSAALGFVAASVTSSSAPLLSSPKAPDVPVASVHPPTIASSKCSPNLAVLQISRSPDPEVVLSLDFGTAKSKAFAANSLEDEPDQFFDLALGVRAGEDDGSVYAVSSAVWVEDDGRVFAGADATRRSLLHADSGRPRQRLDSLKQELSQAAAATHLARPLPVEINPSGVDLSYDDAITFYLGYLTDLAGSELEERHHKSRYVQRRFAIPCWRPEQRAWAGAFISRRLGRAQVVADTFSNRWKEGISARDVRAVLDAAAQHDEQLQGAGWTLEPLAAGSSRVWADRGCRELVAVLDVGAGTTDFSLFWVVQDAQTGKRSAFPVKPEADALRMAGDTLDSVLLQQLLERANLGADEALKRRVSFDLQLKIRRLKEQMFDTGLLIYRLVNDQVVSISRDEFLEAPGVKAFTQRLQAEFHRFLSAVHPSWWKATDSLTMVLTGGGSGLPMITDLAKQRWALPGCEMLCTLAPRLPKGVGERFDEAFAREYPVLAVALGGALPMLLVEGAGQEQWLGGTPAPVGLTRYQVRGI